MDTDWIVEGARVAEYTYSRPPTVRLTTVERLTATQIILANGNRYRRNTLGPVGDSQRLFGAHTDLRRADDDRVRDAYASHHLRALRDTVAQCTADDRAGVLVALDAIEQAVAKTRAAITE